MQFNFLRKGEDKDMDKNELMDPDEQLGMTDVEKSVDKMMDEHLGAEKPEADPGTLLEGEPHPAAKGAMAYVKRWLTGDFKRLMHLQESLASTALAGNRNAEICNETLSRLMAGEPVSDRYLLGLAWTLRNLDEMEDRAPKLITDVVPETRDANLIDDVHTVEEAAEQTAAAVK